MSWTAPAADNGAVTINGYQVHYRQQGTTEWTTYGIAVAAETTSLTLESLQPGATYEVQVRALNESARPAPGRTPARAAPTGRPVRRAALLTAPP